MNWWLKTRRWIDAITAVLLMVVLLPVFLWVAAWVRVRDGSPMLVRLTRVGRGGKEFRIIKFRTMTASDDDGVAGGPKITSGLDERITPTGRILRKHRLDELPQLINVLRGEMALLGPRPETPEYVDLDTEEWRRVLSVRPGIAGLTQLLIADLEPRIMRSGVNDDVYEHQLLPLKLDLDLCYASMASPATDLRIAIDLVVVRTVLKREPLRSRKWLTAVAPELEQRWIHLFSMATEAGEESYEAPT